jgi:hypothetical protein
MAWQPTPETGELPPWRLGGGAAINLVNRRRGQVGKGALERVRRWVNPFEAKEGEGLGRGLPAPMKW